MDTIRRMSKQHMLLVTAVVTLAALALAFFTDVTDNDTANDADPTVVEFLIVSAISIGIAAALIYTVVPRAGNVAAIVLGVLAALSVLVFWSGLPFAFGFPAVYAGVTLRASAAGRTSGTIGAALGALAIVAAIVLCVVG